jgi:glutamyl-tRNA reductase
VALRRHFEAVRAQALRQANGDAARATELLVNRLLHDPSEVLRQIASGTVPEVGDSETAARIVAALFRLDEMRDEEKKR